MRIQEYADGESGASYLTTTISGSDARCASDIDCACSKCLDELKGERVKRGWKDAHFGIALPPILMGGDDAG
jgi:hypothetical protein